MDLGISFGMDAAVHIHKKSYCTSMEWIYEELHHNYKEFILEHTYILSSIGWNLGILLDQTLSMKQHITNVCNSAFI